jgi:hypothetical protein
MGQVLEGKVALVTDGTHGLGASVAEELARQGVHVALGYTGAPDRVDIVAHGLERYGVQGAVFKSSEVERLTELAATRFGRLDIVIHPTEASLSCLTRPIDDECARALEFIAGQLDDGGKVISIGRTLTPPVFAEPRPPWTLALGMVQPGANASSQLHRTIVPVAMSAASAVDVPGSVLFLASPQVGVRRRALRPLPTNGLPDARLAYRARTLAARTRRSDPGRLRPLARTLDELAPS